MKRFIPILFAAGVCALASSNAFAAGSCGAGKILSIKEGGWNSNHFMIKIDYSAEAADVSGHWYGNIRFLNTLHADRFKGIKALAYMAYSGNKTIRVWTSGTNCNQADDITLYAPGSPFP